MVQKEMETPMPQTSSKLADLDYSNFLKKDPDHLSCPECEIIPAIFIEKTSKNLFSISSGCENQHSIHNMNIRDFFQKSVKKNDYNQKEIITLCQEHNEKYQSFCKTCHKNICNTCFTQSHQNHNILKFDDLKPSNDDIKKLKNSITNEIKTVSEFFTLEFNRWIEELKDKFDDLMDIISHKNKLYNKIISNYESGNLNYQIIHNIKVILKDQTTRNPITKELAKLVSITTAAKRENKDGIFNPEKNEKFLQLLDIDNYSMDGSANPSGNKTVIINSNNQAQNNNNINQNNEKSLEDFVNNQSGINKNMINNQNMNSNNDDNSLKKIQTFSKNLFSLNKQKNNNQFQAQSFYSDNKDITPIEFQFKGKKLKQVIDLKEFIHTLTKLKAHNAQKFALGLESGLVKVYSFDEKTGDISLYIDIKEHTKAITYLLGLNNGNLLTCSIDKDIKIINIPKAFFKNYSVVQTIKCAADSFYFQSAIEMTDGNLIAGDWKNIIIWQPTKKSGSNDCEYTELNKIVINNRVTALIQVDDGIFVSAHYGLSIINFFDTVRKNTTTLKNIKCNDESPNCMCIISAGMNSGEIVGNNNDKILIIGGIQCMYFVSIKYRVLIYKLFLPDNTYFRCVFNTGFNFYSSSIMCCGLCNNYLNDLIMYNVISQGGHNKFNLIESYRISEADRNAINSILLLKKKNVTDSSSFYLLTAGNEQKLKVYV